MVDLALLGTGLVLLGSTVATACATSMWRDAANDAASWKQAYKELANRQYGSLPTQVVELSADDIVRPHVLCGACGMSAPVEEDGFTIAEHNCDTRDLFSDYGLRSDQR